MNSTTAKTAPFLPLGRRITLMVAVIAILVAFLLQIVGLIVTKSHLEASHCQTASSIADLMAPFIEEQLLLGATPHLPTLFHATQQSNPDLIYVVVCDSNGIPLAHDFPSALPGELDTLIRERSVPRQERTTLNIKTEKGVLLHLVQPFEGGKAGYLHLGLSWASVDTALSQSCWKLLEAMVAGLVVSALLAWFTYRHLGKPIEELAEAARQFGQSNLSARVTIRPGARDESALLGTAFNDMAARLEHQVNELVQSRVALADEKLRVQAILDGMSQSVTVADKIGNIIYCNHATRIFWPGSSEAAFLQSYATARANHPDMLREFSAVADGKQASAHISQRVGGRDLTIVISRVTSPSGESLGTVEIATDVTEQMHSWRALAHAEKLNVVGQLAAGVAHEINSPLDGAIEASRIIEKNSGEPAKVTSFAQAQRSGLERISAIVRRLLTFSRLPSHKERSLVNVWKLLEEAQSILKHRINHEHISVDLSSFKDRDLLVPGDELSLIQVLVNLINNAIDVTPRNGTVKIDVHVSSATINFSVTDQGPGVSEEAAGKIFTPFFTTKEMGKGTGLGLAVSRNIIEEHSGTIDFTNSTPPWGARFTVSLPRQELIALDAIRTRPAEKIGPGTLIKNVAIHEK